MAKQEMKVVATYLYLDEEGKEVFQVLRLEPKEFRVRHKAPNRHWVWRAPERNVPYRLPELLAAPQDAVVFIVEGEKDVDRLHQLGFVATTNRSGANQSKAFAEWGAFFAGRHVVILPDNDDPGRKHAEAVMKHLERFAEMVVVLALPDLQAKGDVSDWMDAHRDDKEHFLHLANGRLMEQLEPTVPAQAVVPDAYPPGDAFEAQEDQLTDEESLSLGWKPFPVDLLPSSLSDYIHAGATALCCDPAYIAMPTLALVAGVVGNSRVMKLKDTWREPSVLWNVLVADSSTKKSPAFDIARLPIDELIEELMEEYAGESKAWEHRQRVKHAQDGEEIKPRMWKADDADDPKPKEKRLVISDITVETVVQKLDENPRGLLLLRDELRGWFNSFSRYASSKGGGSDIPFWLEVFRASSFVYDRKSGDRTSLYVRRAAVSVCGTIQPSVLAKVFCRDFFESGFAARFLLCSPPKLPTRWTEEGIDPVVRQRYVDVLRGLYRDDYQESQAPKWKPREVTFAPCGKAAWIEFYNEWSERQTNSEGDTAACLSKLEGICARFAMLLCLVDFKQGNVQDTVVTADHMNRAVEMIRWFFDENMRLYHRLSRSEEHLDSDRLLEFVKRKGQVTPRDLFRSNPSKYVSTEKAKSVLEGLVIAEKGFWKDVAPGEKGGRPTKAFVMT